MNYKDKVLIPIMVMLLIISNREICAILILLACYISLEYPLKNRKIYFWITIVYYIVMSIIGIMLLFVAQDFVNYVMQTNNGSNDYVMLILEIAFTITLYYRDNDDFLYREKVKEIIKKKESDETIEE